MQRIYDIAPEIPIDPLASGRERALQTAGSVVHFKRDHEIYAEGNEANIFFKVTAGVVRACKFSNDGRRQIDAFHVVGDMFGFESGPHYGLSAEAVCDCTLTSYRRRDLERLASYNIGLLQQLYSYALQGMARAQEHSLLLGYKSAIEKVAAFLIGWAQHSSEPKMVDLEMTRQDIGDYLGLTIETVSRTLSHLKRQGVIEFQTAHHISLRDLPTLRDLSAARLVKTA